MVTYSPTHAEVASSLPVLRSLSPVRASWDHLPVLLTFKSLFQCLILEDPNRGKGIKELDIYLCTPFRLILYPSSHWTLHLLFVITCHTHKLSCHTIAHPCSPPWKSKIIHLAFKDLHAQLGLPIMPFSSSTPLPRECISPTVLLSFLPIRPSVFPPPCFHTMFPSAPNGFWKVSLHFCSNFTHMAEKNFVPNCKTSSPLSEL